MHTFALPSCNIFVHNTHIYIDILRLYLDVSGCLYLSIVFACVSVARIECEPLVSSKPLPNLARLDYVPESCIN